MPPSDLEAVTPAEQWADLYDVLAERVREHRTTLVFVNNRRLAERIAQHLAQRLGEDAVASHHGSLSRTTRLDAESRLLRSPSGICFATSTLELGIDIGDVD